MEVNGNGTQETSNELDFSWDENDDISAPTVIQQVEDADLSDEEIIEGEKPKKKKDKEEKSVDDSIFNDFSEEVVIADGEDEDEDEDLEEKAKAKKKVKKEENTPSDDEPSGDEPEEKDKEFFTTLSKELKDKGIFSNIEIKDDEEIDEDRFFELQEEEIDSRVEETFKGFFEDLQEDPDAVALIKHVKAGGSSRDFFKTFANSPVVSFPEDYDIEKKGNAAKLVKHYLMTEDGETEEEANESLEILEEKGKVEARAEQYHKKMLAKDAKAKATLLKESQDAQIAREEKAVKYKQGLTKVLNELDEVNNVKFTAEDKKTLVDKITKPSVKIGDNKYITSFQAKMNEIMKDPAKLFLLAKLVDKGLDTSDMIKDITTQQVAKVKSSLNKIGRTGTKKLGNTVQKTKNLADFFE